jgi:hypothetical protein
MWNEGRFSGSDGRYGEDFHTFLCTGTIQSEKSGSAVDSRKIIGVKDERIGYEKAECQHRIVANTGYGDGHNASLSV